MKFRDCMTAAAILALGAGAGWAQDATPKQGGTAVFAIPGDPNLLMRNASSQTVDGAIGCIVYQGMMGSDVEGRPVPLLAESVEIAGDGKAYTFQLRDAKWHDGAPLTSEDVRFTLMEVSAEHSAILGRMAPFIEAVETPDARTVVIRLTGPHSALLNGLTCLQGAGIVRAHVFAGSDLLSNPAMAAPVGTGPFRMTEWVRGSHLGFEAFPDYWEEGKPHLDGLIAQIIPTSAGRVQALMSGEIDRIAEMGMDVASYPVIEANPSTELMVNHEPPGITQVFLNLEHAPLDDVRVRRALLMATDREYIIEAAFGDAAEVARMPFPAGIEWAADPSIDFRTQYPFDVAAAEALLDEAGLARGADGTRFAIDIVYQSTFPGGGEIAARSLDNMWSAVGVEVNLYALEPGAATQRVFVDGDFGAYFINYSRHGRSCAGRGADLRLHLDRHAEREWLALFQPRGGRALRRRGAHGQPGGERRRLPAESSRILAEDLPVLPLLSKITYDAQRTDSHGHGERVQPRHLARRLARPLSGRATRPAPRGAGHPTDPGDIDLAPLLPAARRLGDPGHPRDRARLLHADPARPGHPVIGHGSATSPASAEYMDAVRAKYGLNEPVFMVALLLRQPPAGRPRLLDLEPAARWRRCSGGARSTR